MDRTPVQAAEVFRVSAPEVLGGSAIKVDSSGALFSAVLHYNGNDSAIWVDKTDRAGVVVGSWSVPAPPDGGGFNKQDAGASLAASGPDLLVGMTSHLQANRDFQFSVARIAGVYSPFAGQAPEDGPGAHVPAGGPAPMPQGLSDQDKAWIAAQIAASQAVIVGNLRPKVGAELQAQHVLTTDNVKDTLYQWMKDRIFETAEQNAPGFWAKVRAWAAKP